MDKISRREFLQTFGVSTAVLFGSQLISACGQIESPDSVQTQNQPTEPALSTNQVVSHSNLPDLTVARNGEPEEMTRRAISALGGMQRFVRDGANVIIKPNICVAYHSFEYAATTNPWVVGALVKMCFEAGASKVRVMDFPFGGTSAEAYQRSGIEEQVSLANGEMVGMSRFKFQPTPIVSGRDLREVSIFDEVLRADTIINVPIAKHHNLARLTLGMKNLMGVVLDRGALHRNLGQRLADLTSLVRPTLTVIDAVRVLMAHGPTGGDLADVQQLNTVIASPDIVAADSYATTLFELTPDDISYIRAGAEMGLGRKDLQSLRIEEINLGA